MKTMMFGITISMILTISLILTLIPGSIAQNSPADYLRVHNAARAAVGVGPLTWNNTLASYAQNYASQRVKDCQLIHSNGPYGENLAEGSWPVTGAEAVQRWVGEKPNYDYRQNKCVKDQCLHYTQVVWRKSTSVGCGRVKCNSGWWFIGCNYYPPGNYVGERPY